ncbi:MAG: acyl carrier protein [Kiloniellales bacterium]|nr:acyl carrier protein [Kiloniellales bacterium]
MNDASPKEVQLLGDVRSLVGETLQLGPRTDTLSAASGLFGHLPELDSMAVVTIICAIEDRFAVQFEDDEITAENFATLGSLTSLVEEKLKAGVA